MWLSHNIWTSLLWKIPTTAWTVETGLKFPIIDPLTYFYLINAKNEIFWIDLSDHVCLCRNRQEKGFVFHLVTLFSFKNGQYFMQWKFEFQAYNLPRPIVSSEQLLRRIRVLQKKFKIFSQFQPSEQYSSQKLEFIENSEVMKKRREKKRNTKIWKLSQLFKFVSRKIELGSRLNEVNGSNIFYHPGSTHPKNLS